MINAEVMSARAAMAAFGNETVEFDLGDGSARRPIKAIVDRKGATARFGQKALAAVVSVSVFNDSVTGITPQQASKAAARVYVATDLGGEAVGRRMSIVSQDSGMVTIELL